MTRLVLKSLKQQANAIVRVQCITVLLLAVFFALATGHRAALAALCGGLVYITPGYFYAARLFSDVSARAITRILLVFYLGEVLKLIVSVGLFIAMLTVFAFPLLPYFFGYLVAALSFCVAPLWLMNRTMVSKV